MQVVDQVEEVACVELEGVSFPVLVEDGVEPAIGVYVPNHVFIKACGIKVLRATINSAY
jgi:hypothetical protein